MELGHGHLEEAFGFRLEGAEFFLLPGSHPGIAADLAATAETPLLDFARGADAMKSLALSDQTNSE